MIARSGWRAWVYIDFSVCEFLSLFFFFGSVIMFHFLWILMDNFWQCNLMENSEDLCNIGGDGDGRANYGGACCVPSTSLPVIGRQSSLQRTAGGDNGILLHFRFLFDPWISMKLHCIIWRLHYIAWVCYLERLCFWYINKVL